MWLVLGALSSCFSLESIASRVLKCQFGTSKHIFELGFQQRLLSYLISFFTKITNPRLFFQVDSYKKGRCRSIRPLFLHHGLDPKYPLLSIFDGKREYNAYVVASVPVIFILTLIGIASFSISIAFLVSFRI